MATGVFYCSLVYFSRQGLSGWPASLGNPILSVPAPTLGLQTHALVLHTSAGGPELLLVWPALWTKPFPLPLLLLYVYCQQSQLFQGTGTRSFLFPVLSLET